MATRHNYRLNCDQFVLHDGDKPIGPLLDEVALCVSVNAEDGLITRHRHGAPESVNEWARKTRETLIAKGGPMGQDMANEIRVVQGKLDVKLLNDALEGVQGALRKLVDQDNTIDVEARVVDVIEDETPSRRPMGPR